MNHFLMSINKTSLVPSKIIKVYIMQDLWRVSKMIIKLKMMTKDYVYHHTQI